MKYNLYFKPSNSTEIAGYLRLEIDGIASSGYLVLPSTSDLLDPDLAVKKISQYLDNKDSFLSPCISMLSVDELADPGERNPYELLESFELSSKSELKSAILDLVKRFPELIPELYL